MPNFSAEPTSMLLACKDRFATSLMVRAFLNALVTCCGSRNQMMNHLATELDGGRKQQFYVVWGGGRLARFRQFDADCGLDTVQVIEQPTAHTADRSLIDDAD
ncbi:unnamed protein product [Haemonchus placei]|uniref:SAM-dependent methyltransferase n=1 Tax=Haemonchus placei TaxID=6290 RepID=A0A0N4WSY4_HAEPC|nr:unnamed protein product [Haemonchus placei]